MTSAPIDLMTLAEQFGTDERCREALKHLRWPKGVTCLRCGHDKVMQVNARKVFDCNSCHYQFSVTVGTMFHDSHLPLTKWFLITYLLTESKKGISASQVYRMLGKKSYKTAWYLCHRIRAAMAAAQPMTKLDGRVEMDETYVGGKSHGYGQRWRGERHKREVVIGIRQRSGDLRFFHAEDAKSGTLAKDGRTHLAHKAEHAVDLDTGAVVAVTLQGADQGDTTTLDATLSEAGLAVAQQIGREAEQRPDEKPQVNLNGIEELVRFRV